MKCPMCNAEIQTADPAYVWMERFYDVKEEHNSLKQQLAEALAKLEKFEKMEPIVFVDSGHLREVSNGNDMLIYAQCEQDEQGRLEPLYAHP